MKPDQADGTASAGRPIPCHIISARTRSAIRGNLKFLPLVGDTNDLPFHF
jgi:hypothetical protein